MPTIEVAVTDVVPLADTDPRGTGLASAMFPLVLGGMAGGIAIAFVVIGAMRRILAVVVYSAGAGLALAGILGGWFGSLPGDYWLNVGAIALTLLAISAFITGMAALLGRAGLGLGALTMILVANPISSAAVPKEFLPAPWGEVGQWFPPGDPAADAGPLSEQTECGQPGYRFAASGFADDAERLALLDNKAHPVHRTHDRTVARRTTGQLEVLHQVVDDEHRLARPADIGGLLAQGFLSCLRHDAEHLPQPFTFMALRNPSLVRLKQSDVTKIMTPGRIELIGAT